MTFTPVSLLDFEREAQQRMTQMAFEYYQGGAMDEITLAHNRTAFDQQLLRPRMMANVANRDFSTTVLGQRWAHPWMIAPMAFAKLAHADGEQAVMRAARKRQVGVTLSTMSTTPMEEVSATAHATPAADTALWYQLYVYKDRAITKDLIQRAEASGYQALVLTVDTPYLGKREKDVRNSFHLPEGLSAANLSQSDGGARVGAVRGDSGLAAYMVDRYDPSLTWVDVATFASWTRLPILVKGVLRGDDAALAVGHGARGIIVSNHGGRQLDTAIPTLRALPDVLHGADGRADVLLDGGVRRGTDIVKALALGAKAVLVGRPMYYALAVGGETGVLQALDILRDEFDLALALCGVARAAALSRDLLA
jgi:4-hydroxymandelate oxidase